MKTETFQAVCSQDFLTELESDRVSIGIFPASDIDKQQSEIWQKLIDFLDYHRTSLVIVAAEPEKLLNGVIFRYLNRNGMKNIKIITDPKYIDVEKINHPYCFYFGLPNLKNKILGLGFPCIHAWKEDWRPFYASNAIQIQRSTHSTVLWKKMEAYFQQPFHSLVIVDNYIVANYHAMLNNLFRVLSVMLMKGTCNKEIHITIFTNKLYKNKHKQEQEESLENLYQKIHSHISSLLGRKPFKLGVVKISSSENHDRHIFTNCFVFRSGNSFTYFDQHLQVSLPSTTDFDIYPQPAHRATDVKTADYYHSELAKFGRILLDKHHEAAGYRLNRLLEANSDRD